MCHIIETIECMGKKLICHIQPEEKSYEILNEVVQTTKWLRLEDWLQIYKQLEARMSECNLEEGMDSFSTNSFFVSHCTIEVKIEKCPLQKHLKYFFESDDDEFISVYLKLSIARVKVENLMEKIKLLEQERERGIPFKNGKIKTRKDLHHEYDPIKDGKGNKTDITLFVPYKPSSRRSNNQTSSSETSPHEKDPYTPKPIDVTDSPQNGTPESLSQDTPTYKPSKILKDNNSTPIKVTSSPDVLDSDKRKKGAKKKVLSIKIEESTTNDKTLEEKRYSSPSRVSTVDSCDERQTRSKRKYGTPSGKKVKSKLSEDLFGSEESDNDQGLVGPSCSDDAFEQKSSRNKDKRKLKPAKLLELKKKCLISKRNPKRVLVTDFEECTSTKSKRKRKFSSTDDNMESERSRLTGWLSKSMTKSNGNREQDGAKKSKTSKNNRKRQIPLVITPQGNKLTDEEKQKIREKDEMEIKCLLEINKEVLAQNKTPPKVDFLKLKHLTCENIFATFDEIKPELNRLFRENKKRKDLRSNNIIGMDHLLTMNLVDQSILMKMMDCLRENYESDPLSIPIFTDIFMNVLLPEWTLHLFMKEHKFSREEAIKRIIAQEEASDILINSQDMTIN